MKERELFKEETAVLNGVDKKHKADFILIIILLLATAVFFCTYVLIYNDKGANVVVEVDGNRIITLPLDKDLTMDVKGIKGINTFEIKDGEVRMHEAECLDGICVQHRAISRNGESIICLPNRIVLRITGAEESEVDAIAN